MQTEFIFGYYFNIGEPDNKILSLDSLDTDKQHWLHFDYTSDSAKQWLNEQSQLPEVVVSALLNEETRPRATVLMDGVLISLRGVNLSPNSNPEDMVSIRLWFTKDKIISTRRRLLLSTKDIAVDFDKGIGPQTPSAFITLLADRLISRMSHTIYEIEDKVSDIEENILVSSSYTLRSELSDIRRQIISLRRYLSPQREAMTQLLSDKISLFSVEEKIQLRETADHLTRLIEDLDSAKDRAIVSQEELNNTLAEQMNNRMFVLSIVAALFLPLGFLTGLLGINVGGIPGAENSYAFAIFVGILIVIVAFQVWLFKKKKWF
ncbi:zinc transporter ZntB [uncultured Paraglaciecola sp.]|uniref:zinc transporter ZntB n=1 Tax=uncultured Paraglaciecola sp. TaxID=1765024 RepID=UPI002621B7F8|nr:zinc transporter ZntB [uncultured Paraglaciecola sp.]